MTECSWAQPIYVSQNDQLTTDTARQILRHNKTGKKVCGWNGTTSSED